MKFVLVADIQGNWDQLDRISESLAPDDIIIHTGNFGFWDKNTIANSDINYLKQLIPFLTKLPDGLVQDLINRFNILNNNGMNQDIIDDIKQKIINNFDYLQAYLTGQRTFKNRIYTIYGPLDDPNIVSKLLSAKEYNIPNLHIIDFQHHYIVPTNGRGPDLKIYGLSGKFKFINLFNQGQIGHLTDGNINGNLGELWMTLLQISKFYQLNCENLNTINLFVSYNCIIKTPLVEYLSMVTNANFTISSSLHFKFPIIGNEMSFNHNLELFKLKFCKFRIKLGELFKLIKPNLSSLEVDSSTLNQLQIGLNIFDKIPIIQSNQIITLKLIGTSNCNGLNNPGFPGNGSGGGNSGGGNTNEIISKINEMYFENFYNLWHLNLCDVNINNKLNLIKLNYENGLLNIEECINSGLDFNYKSNNTSTENLAEVHNELFDNEIDPIISSGPGLHEYSDMYNGPEGIKTSNNDNFENGGYKYDETVDEHTSNILNTNDDNNNNTNDDYDEGFGTEDNNDTTNEYDYEYGSGRGNRGNKVRGRGSRGRGRGIPRGRGTSTSASIGHGASTGNSGMSGNNNSGHGSNSNSTSGSSTRGTRGSRGRSRPRARGRFR